MLTVPTSFLWLAVALPLIPVSMSRRWNYRRLTAEQFRERLDGLGWSAARFAFVYGAREDRVKDWRNGKEDVPHTAGLVLRLLKLQGARTAAFEHALEHAEATERQAAFADRVEARRAAGVFDDRWQPETDEARHG